MPPELYGPFGALAVLAFIVVAVIRGDLVPGFVYRRETKRGDDDDVLWTEVAGLLREYNALLREVVRFLDMPPPDDGAGR